MGDIAINCEQITQTADAPPFVSHHHDNIHGAKAWYDDDVRWRFFAQIPLQLLIM